MRLIDADALKEEIESLTVRVTGLRAGKGILSEYAKQYRESVLRIINEQPTAYDVEKVVEQIEFSKDCRALLGNMPKGQLSASDSAFNEAIEISRKGGVNERD